jgi:hypothetical protein
MLAATRAALAAGGADGVWSERPDPAFEASLRALGFWCAQPAAAAACGTPCSRGSRASRAG